MRLYIENFKLITEIVRRKSISICHEFPQPKKHRSNALSNVTEPALQTYDFKKNITDLTYAKPEYSGKEVKKKKTQIIQAA